MTRAEILAVARAEIGRPWMHQARAFGVAYDCLGFLICVAAECGSAEAQRRVADPSKWAYGREPNPEAMFAGCDEDLDRVPTSQVLAADIAIMKMPKWPIHFGFIGDGDPATLIHCSRPHRRVVEHRLDEGWRSRIVRVYRVRGVA